MWWGRSRPYIPIGRPDRLSMDCCRSLCRLPTLVRIIWGRWDSIWLWPSLWQPTCRPDCLSRLSLHCHCQCVWLFWDCWIQSRDVGFWWEVTSAIWVWARSWSFQPKDWPQQVSDPFRIPTQTSCCSSEVDLLGWFSEMFSVFSSCARTRWRHWNSSQSGLISFCLSYHQSLGWTHQNWWTSACCHFFTASSWAWVS